MINKLFDVVKGKIRNCTWHLHAALWLLLCCVFLCLLIFRGFGFIHSLWGFWPSFVLFLFFYDILISKNGFPKENEIIYSSFLKLKYYELDIIWNHNELILWIWILSWAQRVRILLIKEHELLNQNLTVINIIIFRGSIYL